MSEQGIVKWYSLAKGYGFIRRESAGEDDDDGDVFVHHTELPDDTSQPRAVPLTEGDLVSFEIVDGPKGLKARNVQRVAPEDDPG